MDSVPADSGSYYFTLQFIAESIASCCGPAAALTSFFLTGADWTPRLLAATLAGGLCLQLLTVPVLMFGFQDVPLPDHGDDSVVARNAGSLSDLAAGSGAAIAAAAPAAAYASTGGEAPLDASSSLCVPGSDAGPQDCPCPPGQSATTAQSVVEAESACSALPPPLSPPPPSVSESGCGAPEQGWRGFILSPSAGAAPFPTSPHPVHSRALLALCRESVLTPFALSPLPQPRAQSPSACSLASSPQRSARDSQRNSFPSTSPDAAASRR